MALQVCGQCGTRYAIGVDRCPHCSSTALAADDIGRVPLAVTARCINEQCEATGKPRRVVLRRAAMGVVELPTLLCEVCGYVCARSWPGPLEEETDMPKITVHGGASNAADGPRVLGGAWGDETETESREAASSSEPESGNLPAAETVTADEDSQVPGEALEPAAAPSQPLPETVEGDTTELVSEPDYESWNLDQLRSALTMRGLPKSGNKAELIARLQQDDAENAPS